MGKSKKIRRLEKSIRIKNRKLVKKYPWLKPWRRWHRGKEQYGWNKEDKYKYTAWNGLPKGWDIAFQDLLLEELDNAVERAGLENEFHIIDMKEKWGRADIHVSGCTEEIDNIISKYELLSEHICAFCGKPDVPMTSKGWLLPLCYDCFTKHWYHGDDAEKVYSDYLIRGHNMINTVEYADGKTDISDTAQKIRSRWYKNHK